MGAQIKKIAQKNTNPAFYNLNALFLGLNFSIK
jgi:hypothetical protein